MRISREWRSERPFPSPFIRGSKRARSGLKAQRKWGPIGVDVRKKWGPQRGGIQRTKLMTEESHDIDAAKINNDPLTSGIRNRISRTSCPTRCKIPDADPTMLTKLPPRIYVGANVPCIGSKLPLRKSVIKVRNQSVKELYFYNFWLLFLMSMFGVISSASELSEEFGYYIRERAEAAKKWAPLIFLHPEERFFPSAVHTFLKNVVPREVLPSQKPPDPPMIVSMSRSLDIQSLPVGPDGEDTYLFAPIDPECKNCPLPKFLFGDKPTSDYTPPVYAVISSCLPSQRTFRRARNYKTSSRPPQPRRKFRLRSGFSSFRSREPRSTTQYYHSYAEPPFTLKPNILKREAVVRHTDSFNSLNDSPDDSVPYPTKGKVLSPSSTLLPPQNDFLSTDSQEKMKIPSPELQVDSSEFLHKENDNTTDSEETTEYINSNEQSAVHEASLNVTTNKIEFNNTSESEKTRVIREPDILSGSHIQYLSTYESNGTNERHRQRGHRFTVTYWMFYPFSQGKEVCTSRMWLLGRVFKPRLRNKCFGEMVTLNSHVGDWEHVSIYFEDELPQMMYVSMHTYGAFYSYNPRENIFVLRGRDTRDGLPLNPKYPTVVKMDGTHPVLYSALGSHGLWAGPGAHRYENLVPLDDKTAAGIPWELWKNIDIIDNKESEYDRPDRQWLHFHGRWGNPASNCHRALFGTCDLASGPTGIPLKRPNFPCHMPNHPTFTPKT